MKAVPRASVCIPTCDGDRFVAEAIDSVLQQTFQDFELIVVDDCSSDGTLEIVGSYRDPRLKVHRNAERLGLAKNWNRCLELARGEFFCLFHQDDVMFPDNLDRKVRLLEPEPAVGLVHSAVEFVSEAGAPPGSGRWVEDATEAFVVDGRRYFRTMILSGNRVCAPAVVARRAVLADLGGFNESLGFALDYEMWLKVCVNWQVGFLSQPLLRYRWHPKNASHAYRYERALNEAAIAVANALAFHKQCDANVDERELLTEAVAVLNRQRRWTAELEKGNDWLSQQYGNWRRLAEERDSTIHELSRHIAELQEAREWLTQQYNNWKGVAEQRDAIIAELRGWIDQLEKARG